MRQRTALIVPAMSDQAGQCRIVAADGVFSSPLASYRENPDTWQEVGLMNSHGRIVALEDCAQLRDAFADCEPCAAGMVVEYVVP